MTILLDQSFPRSLDHLADGVAPGSRLEAWVFEGVDDRSKAEAALRDRGIQATIHSAYKPLVNFFLDDFAAPRDVVIAPPDMPGAMAGRFRMETYPLAGLMPDSLFSFADPVPGSEYHVTLDGVTQRVFAPNRIRRDHLGQDVLAPCGWLKITAADGAVLRDAPLETETELMFAAVMIAVAEHQWPVQTPYFRTLLIEAALPYHEEELTYFDEVLSIPEALHEDLYFSVLELMQHRAGRMHGDRTVQPGQIIPEIREGAPHLRISLTDPPAMVVQAGPADLNSADRPLTPDQIATALAAFGGERFSFQSVQGRKIAGTIIDGSAAPVVISAGQHANETSGVVGALRAARELAGSFALIPMENPDGYALHHQLRAARPRHMHHAARYTALGDDLESRGNAPFHEREARMHALKRTGARLHISLHGYPAHEWTRPFTGYLPRGFESWSIPKGFFLILRHHPGLAGQAEAFLRKLCARIAADPAVREFNREQLRVWHAYAGAPPFPMFDDIACMISEVSGQAATFTLITEYPDETIYDEAFRLAHTTQMRTVLAAVELFRAGAAG